MSKTSTQRHREWKLKQDPEKLRAMWRAFAKKYYIRKTPKPRGHYNKKNFIRKYTRAYYEKVYWVEHAEEINQSPLVITDEWGNIIGYTLNRFYY